MLTIAAVIPCRNAAAWIEETIASVRSQTRPVAELIVSDDGSTDDSATRAAAAGAVVVRPLRGGNASRARNAGWRASGSELIAFLDADDRWAPEHLAVVAGVFERHPEVVLAFGQAERFGLQTGRFNCELPLGVVTDARAAAAILCTIPQSAVIVRRSALERVGGYDDEVSTAEDYDFFGRVAHCGPFFACPEVTTYYRQHQGQDTRRRRLAFIFATIEIRERHLRALESQLPADELHALERRAAGYWAEVLDGAWRYATRAEFDRLLVAGMRFPEMEPEVRRWRTRARWQWTAWHIAAGTWRFLRLRRVLNALTRRN
ncbi:MAG: glycosyltransferase [Gemmatimonadaceae bacterium]|nr:glycosyltransferase [Gemmatimonadaceae bacterium]